MCERATTLLFHNDRDNFVCFSCVCVLNNGCAQVGQSDYGANNWRIVCENRTSLNVLQLICPSTKQRNEENRIDSSVFRIEYRKITSSHIHRWDVWKTYICVSSNLVAQAMRKRAYHHSRSKHIKNASKHIWHLITRTKATMWQRTDKTLCRRKLFSQLRTRHETMW